MNKTTHYLIKTYLKKLQIVILMICFICTLPANSYAVEEFSQEKLVSMNLVDVNLIKVFDEIKKQTSYSFWYRNNDINMNEKLSVRVDKKTVTEVLDQILKGRNLQYEIKENHIVISKVNTGSGVSGPQQEKKIVKGFVTDDSGAPVIGASVRVKGGATGTITDMEGQYSIPVDNEKTILVFSYLGYKTSESQVGKKSSLDVVLTEDTQILNEVVVTGYQTISRERSTGAFVMLNKEELNTNISVGANAAIKGKAAGVTMYNNNIVIRGESTFSENVGTNPLLVVDGLPTERTLSDFNTEDIERIDFLKDASATSIYGVRAANGVIVVTTKKAEKGKTRVNFSSTLTVSPCHDLSDYRYASTSEILDFTERAYQANMKRTSGGEAAYFSSRKKIGDSGIAYWSPFEELHRQLYLGNINQQEFNQTIDGWRGNDYRQEYKDLLTQTPISQNYNLSVSKESGGINTYLSVNYSNSNHQAIKANSGEALKVYLKVGMDLTKWLTVTVGTDTRYGKSKTTGGGSETNIGTGQEAYTTILNADGTRNYNSWGSGAKYVSTAMNGGGMNPLVMEQLADVEAALKTRDPLGYSPLFKSYDYNIMDEMERNFTESNTFRSRSFVDLKFKLMKGLDFSSSFNYEFNQSRSETLLETDSYAMRMTYNAFITQTDPNNDPLSFKATLPDGNRFTKSQSTSFNYTFRNQLNYNTTLKEKHAITGLVGFEMRENQSPQGVNRMVWGYDSQTLNYQLIDEYTLNQTGIRSYIYQGNDAKMMIMPGNKYDESINRFVSLYANGGYTYNNLYGVTGSVRIDETNLFTKDKQYRYRPLWSMGATWNAGNEEFVKDIAWIDRLKLRASYGVGGNVDKSSTPYLIGTVTVAGNRIPPTRTVGVKTAPNPLLRWEKTTSYNVGVDFSVLKSKLHGTVDLYYKYSDDLLCQKTTDKSSGYTTMTLNNGAMSNRGIELTLKSPWLKRNDWTLNTTFILSYNKNVVEKVGLVPTRASEILNSPASYMQVGYPRNAVYAYRYGGLTSGGTDKQNGIPYIIDANGNPSVVLTPDGNTSFYKIDNLEDVYFVGTSTPPYSFSLNQGVKYKSFELNAMFLFYGGHKIRRPSLSVATNGGTALTQEALLAWTPENQSSNLPKLYPDYEVDQTSFVSLYIDPYWRKSDVHIVSGDFIRLNNVTLSYTVPVKWARAIYAQHLKLALQVNNPWYWSAAGDDIDPETRQFNTVDRTLSAMPSYVFRLDVSF